MKNITYLLAAAVLLAACNAPEKGKEAAAAAAPAAMAMSFETISLAKTNPKVKVKLPGEIVADKEVAIYAKVNSYVKSLKADIGSTVAQGQVILVLEAPEIAAQIASARAKWKAQEAIYTATKASYDRILKASQTEGAIASDAIDQITARKLADEAQLAAARSAYEELVAIEDYLVIRAPFSGVVTQRNTDLGAYVGPAGKGSDKPLLVVQTNKQLRLSLLVPEANTPYLHLGDSIYFTVNALPQQKFSGIVSRKSGALDSRLRAEKIEVDVMNDGGLLKPLMVAEAMLPLQAKEASFFVPKTAVVESNMAIYLIKIENGKTKKVPVTKGRAMPKDVEVFGALAEGDAVLVKASEEMMEGMSIQTKPIK